MITLQIDHQYTGCRLSALKLIDLVDLDSAQPAAFDFTIDNKTNLFHLRQRYTGIVQQKILIGVAWSQFTGGRLTGTNALKGAHFFIYR